MSRAGMRMHKKAHERTREGEGEPRSGNPPAAPGGAAEETGGGFLALALLGALALFLLKRRPQPKRSARR